MADQIACNINFFLYTRFILGFYHEFQSSKQIRWLARCYCCLISVNIIFFYYYFGFGSPYPKSIIFILSTEYLVYMLISLLKSNKYLLQYYKKTPLIDASASTYKPMRVCLYGYMCLAFLLKLYNFIEDSIEHWDGSVTQHMFGFFEFIIWYAVSIGRSPILFVFALLYTRVRLMRQTLENNNFDCRNQGKYHPRRYIQMYEAIMDGLEASDGPMMLQSFVSFLFSSTLNLLGSLYFIYYLKIYAFDFDTFGFVLFMVELTINGLPLFLSAVLVDLVSMERQEMLGIILERSIVCNNERDREEIQKLFKFLKSNPIEYSLWRVVPLNVRSLLSFFSFTVTTIIAVLQIHDWTA